jgi:hypothetical protein
VCWSSGAPSFAFPSGYLGVQGVQPLFPQGPVAVKPLVDLGQRPSSAEAAELSSCWDSSPPVCSPGPSRVGWPGSHSGSGSPYSPPCGFLASMLFLLWTAVASIVLTVPSNDQVSTRVGVGVANPGRA